MEKELWIETTKAIAEWDCEVFGVVGNPQVDVYFKTDQGLTFGIPINLENEKTMAASIAVFDSEEFIERMIKERQEGDASVNEIIEYARNVEDRLCDIRDTLHIIYDLRQFKEDQAKEREQFLKDRGLV